MNHRNSNTFFEFEHLFPKVLFGVPHSTLSRSPPGPGGDGGGLVGGGAQGSLVGVVGVLICRAKQSPCHLGQPKQDGSQQHTCMGETPNVHVAWNGCHRFATSFRELGGRVVPKF